MTCRRCSECRGAEHHWIESVYGEEPIHEGSPSHICKHCDATGDECEKCGGYGEIATGSCGGCETCRGYPESYPCDACGGYGIVVRPTQRTGEGSR